MHLYRDHAAINEGDFQKVASSNDAKIYAFVRSHGTDRVLTVLNLSDAAQTFSLQNALQGGVPQGGSYALLNEGVVVAWNGAYFYTNGLSGLGIVQLASGEKVRHDRSIADEKCERDAI